MKYEEDTTHKEWIAEMMESEWQDLHKYSIFSLCLAFITSSKPYILNSISSFKTISKHSSIFCILDYLSSHYLS